MNILFISIAWPEPGNRNLYTDLMDEFVSNGHSVYVVGTQDADMNTRHSLTEENGIRILRVLSGKIRQTSYIRKFISLISLGGKMMVAIKESFGQENFDLIIGPTPPITLSRLFKRLRKYYDAPFYLLLKDIWPQGSVDLKVFRKYSLPWLFFRSHEVRTYKVADYIGCMSPLGRQYVLDNNSYLPEQKVEVCPNSIRPISSVPENISFDIRDKYNIPRDACVFLFSGNLGIGHGLHFLTEAIKALADYPGAFFVIGGSGTQFQYLQKSLAEFSPPNALLYSFLPRKDFEQMVATSDVGLIFLYRYTSPQFPSRILSYFEYAKPTLCAVNRETDIGTIVDANRCGRSVIHGDLRAFIDEVKYFSENESERKKMGKNGRKLLMDRYTARHSYEIIMSHF